MPAAQLEQLTDPELAPYMPEGQPLQLTASVVKDPAAHDAQLTDDMLDWKPAGQEEQRSAVAEEYVPLGHAATDESPEVGQKYPTPQFSQEVDPEAC